MNEEIKKVAAEEIVTEAVNEEVTYKKNLEELFRDKLLIKIPPLYKIFCKYEEILVYLVVGVLTTIVSWVACWVFERFWLDPSDDIQNLIINTIGWVAGVCFAYPLNRSWVFKSHNPEIGKEFLGFAGSRLSTWFLDLFIMWLTVNILGMGYWIAKICISAVLVTILNYVFSKILIFKKKEN